MYNIHVYRQVYIPIYNNSCFDSIRGIMFLNTEFGSENIKSFTKYNPIKGNIINASVNPNK